MLKESHKNNTKKILKTNTQHHFTPFSIYETDFQLKPSFIFR